LTLAGRNTKLVKDARTSACVCGFMKLAYAHEKCEKFLVGYPEYPTQDKSI